MDLYGGHYEKWTCLNLFKPQKTFHCRHRSAAAAGLLENWILNLIKCGAINTQDDCITFKHVWTGLNICNRVLIASLWCNCFFRNFELETKFDNLLHHIYTSLNFNHFQENLNLVLQHIKISFNSLNLFLTLLSFYYWPYRIC